MSEVPEAVGVLITDPISQITSATIGLPAKSSRGCEQLGRGRETPGHFSCPTFSEHR